MKHATSDRAYDLEGTSGYAAPGCGILALGSLNFGRQPFRLSNAESIRLKVPKFQAIEVGPLFRAPYKFQYIP